VTSSLDKLNLRPSEKRLVVGIGAVLFIVLNAWFVFPHFSDLGRARWRRQQALDKLNKWQAEIAQAAKYKAGIASFLKEGQEVPPEEQESQFAHTIQNQQAQSHVGIQQFGRVTSQTNQFFVELAQEITVQSGEAQLVDFLYSLGSGNSLIRVRDLTLHPDAPHYQLNGRIKLVASFQKNSPRAGAPGPRRRAASARMVTSLAR
jgi:hypothetical protein